MATLRRSIVVSTLFTLFGGPGFVLVYLPFLITHFHIPAGVPFWQEPFQQGECQRRTEMAARRRPGTAGAFTCTLKAGAF